MCVSLGISEMVAIYRESFRKQDLSKNKESSDLPVPDFDKKVESEKELQPA
jgi:hypothetical protein